MAKRKYISEFGLNAFCDGIALTQQDRLTDVTKMGLDPHIYIIGRRPRITIDPASVIIDDREVRGVFKIQKGESFESHNFLTHNLLGTSQVTFEADYPYTECRIRDQKGNVISSGKTALVLATFGSMYWNLLDLEVLYVGQAYGESGERTAIDRLQKHSTLQSIYAEAIQRSPDQDVWIVLMNYEYLLLSSIDGRSKDYEATEEEDTAHIHNVVSTPISEQQRINFAEAALIKYFLPEYNKIFKDTFPHPGHSTYSQCYELDLNTLCIELGTEQIMSRLWSSKVPPAWNHFYQFPMHSVEERKKMFDLS